jgi:hypothetical protein
MSYNIFVVDNPINKEVIMKEDKQLVLFDVCAAHVDFDTNLDEIISTLQGIKDEFITDQVAYHTTDLTESGLLRVEAYREETDKEWALRLGKDISELDRTISYHIDNEHEVYLRLKAKYEK